MKTSFHESYRAALPGVIAIQILLLGISCFLSQALFFFLLVPSIAYWGIAFVVIRSRPRPTPLAIQMIDMTGYACYIACAGAMETVAGIFGQLKEK